MSPSSRQAIYDSIDAHLDEHVEHPRSWILQRSVSNAGEGIDECAQFTRRFLDEPGCRHSEVVDPGPSHWGYDATPWSAPNTTPARRTRSSST